MYSQPKWSVVVVGWAISLGCILSMLLSSCGGHSKMQPVVLHTLECLDSPPPPVPQTVVDGVVEAECPPQFVCIKRDAAIDLATWLSDLTLYARSAWARCGPAPAGGAAGGSSSAAARSWGGARSASAASRSGPGERGGARSGGLRRLASAGR